MEIDRSARDREEKSPRSAVTSFVRSFRLAGSLLFIKYEPAIIPIPMTVVNGSGAIASAMPVFLIVPLSDAGRVRALRLRTVSLVSRAPQTWTVSREVLLTDSTSVRIITRSFSGKIATHLHR
jgi:hypothetical protein